MNPISRLPGGWWGVVFPTVCGLLAVMLALSDVPLERAWIGYAFLVLLGVGWLPAGSRALDDGPFTIPVSAALVAATATLCWLAPSLATIQVLAYPYAWAASNRRVQIAITNLGVAAAVAAGLMLYGDGSSRAVYVSLANAAGGLAFSVAMGSWVKSTARQAAAHAVLQARLDTMSEELSKAHREAGAAAERERFAHEVHDTLTQTLTGVVMLAERAGAQLRQDPEGAAATISTAERTARQALAETRSLIAEGHGTQVGDDGLRARIRRLCDQFGEETGVRTSTELTGGFDALPRSDQVVLLRCLQETLANTRKHARASAVHVELGAADGVILTVADDGVGFPDDVKSATARGYGLAGMASRLALADGSLSITTGAWGTRVQVRLPEAPPTQEDPS